MTPYLDTNALADIVAFDKGGRPVLLADVWVGELGPRSLGEAWERRRSERNTYASTNKIPFCMDVNLSSILIVNISALLSLMPKDGAGPGMTGAHSCSLGTTDVLSYYDSEFANKTIYRTYLTTLVDLWIMDLASQWKPGDPPGKREIQEVGLLPLLEGASTRLAG